MGICTAETERKHIASVKHIEYLLRQIQAARLYVPPGFPGELKSLQQCYNGIGPACWSSRFREVVTELLQRFEPEALIHDWEYTYLPKTYWSFTLANLRFLYNGIKYAIFDYGISRVTINQVRLAICLTVLCQLFGWNGFKKTEFEK